MTSRRIYQNTSKTTGLCPIFTLTSAVPDNQLSKQEREERNKQFKKEFNEMVEKMDTSITMDQVIKKCKKDRRFYEELLMKLDDGILFRD